MSKLLNDLLVLKFVTKNGLKKNDLSGSQCYFNKNIRLELPMLISDLCDFSDISVVVKTIIRVTGTNNGNRRKKS